jgi:hypothetical protein
MLYVAAVLQLSACSARRAAFLLLLVPSLSECLSACSPSMPSSIWELCNQLETHQRRIHPLCYLQHSELVHVEHVA